MSNQPIEYRQIYARMYSVRVHGGKLFTDRAAQYLQEGHYREALQDLAIARSFFPENEKLNQLIKLVKVKRARAQQGLAPEPEGSAPSPHIAQPLRQEPIRQDPMRPMPKAGAANGAKLPSKRRGNKKGQLPRPRKKATVTSDAGNPLPPPRKAPSSAEHPRRPKRNRTQT